MEYRETYIEGVSVSECGAFMVNGAKRSLKKHKSGFYLCFGGSKGRTYLHAANLVASAWCGGWYPGCHIVYKDNDKFNIEAGNLEPQNGKNYLKWRGERISVEKAKAEQRRARPKWEEFGMFKDTGIMGIECTEDGFFRRGYKEIKVRREMWKGRKVSAYIELRIDRKIHKFIAGDLVARAWSPNVYFENCYILYRDGDRHNIHNDNIVLATEDEYFKKRKPLHKPMEFDEVFEMASTMSVEAALYVDYLKTGDMNGINRYIEQTLIKKMICWEERKFNWSKEKSEDVLYEALGFLYMRIGANRPFFGFEKYLKCIIGRYVKEKSWGITERFAPRNIINYVSLLKNECLCKKMKVKKIK